MPTTTSLQGDDQEIRNNPQGEAYDHAQEEEETKMETERACRGETDRPRSLSKDTYKM